LQVVRQNRRAHRKYHAGVPATVRTTRCAHQRWGECRVQSSECRIRNSAVGTWLDPFPLAYVLGVSLCVAES
jgi:hypothetical protein